MNIQQKYLEQRLQAAENVALPILQKYYAVGEPAYNILLTHSRQVARKAMEVMLNHPELDVDVDFVLEAAYLHDIGIFRCNAPIIGCNGHHQYIEHGYLGADILRQEGLSRHALVAERHTGVGISKCQIVNENLPLPKERVYEADTLEEKIVSYADKFYSKTHLDRPSSKEKIYKKLINFGLDAQNRFKMWDETFG